MVLTRTSALVRFEPRHVGGTKLEISRTPEGARASQSRRASARLTKRGTGERLGSTQ